MANNNDFRLEVVNSQNQYEYMLSLSNWFRFSRNYLEIAESACQSYLNNQTYYEKGLYIPIIYNIKHSLEVIIKFFSKHAVNKYEPTHDLNKLFEDFNSSIRKKIKNKNEKDRLFQQLDIFQSYVRRYYSFQFLHQHTINENLFIMDDVENTFFKYPELSKVKVTMDFNKLTEKLSNVDFEYLLEDIKEIKQNFVEICKILDKHLQNPKK